MHFSKRGKEPARVFLCNALKGENSPFGSPLETYAPTGYTMGTVNLFSERRTLPRNNSVSEEETVNEPKGEV